MSEIQAGDGYRLLGPDEIVRQGDEFLCYGGDWDIVTTKMIGYPAAGTVVSRRIPAKPEAMEIDGHTIINDNGFPRFSNAGNSAYYFSSIPESIRQLADWLTRYADWREAQDAK